MHTSLILCPGHEFNASICTARVIAGTGADMYSAIAGAIGALRGPKHGCERSHIRDPAALRNARSSSSGDTKMYSIAERLEAVMKQAKNMFPNLDWYSAFSYHNGAAPWHHGRGGHRAEQLP